MLVPVLAVVVLSESIAGLAVAGIVTIVFGIYILSWAGNFGRLARDPMGILKNAGTRYPHFFGLRAGADRIFVVPAQLRGPTAGGRNSPWGTLGGFLAKRAIW